MNDVQSSVILSVTVRISECLVSSSLVFFKRREMELGSQFSMFCQHFKEEIEGDGVELHRMK